MNACLSILAAAAILIGGGLVFGALSVECEDRAYRIFAPGFWIMAIGCVAAIAAGGAALLPTMVLHGC